MGLKDNSLAIQTVIGSWWEQLELNTLGQLDKGRYLEINIALHHLVQPGISDKEAFETANLDFNEDTKRLREASRLEKGKIPMMDFDSFYESMFELCDTWVNTTEEADYIDFIVQMQTAHMEYVARVTRSISRAGVKYRTIWKRSATHVSISLQWAKAAHENEHRNTANKLRTAHMEISDEQRKKLLELLDGMDEETGAGLLKHLTNNELDGEGQAALLKLLANSSKEEQQELLAVLGRLDDGAKAQLLHALATCGSAAQRNELLAVLGGMDGEGQAALLKLLANSSKEEQQELLAVLGRLDAGSMKRLLRALGGLDAAGTRTLLKLIVSSTEAERSLMLAALLRASKSSKKLGRVITMLHGRQQDKTSSSRRGGAMSPSPAAPPKQKNVDIDIIVQEVKQIEFGGQTHEHRQQEGRLQRERKRKKKKQPPQRDDKRKLPQDDVKQKRINNRREHGKSKPRMRARTRRALPRDNMCRAVNDSDIDTHDDHYHELSTSSLPPLPALASAMPRFRDSHGALKRTSSRGGHLYGLQAVAAVEG
jgi:hypothetical protein